MNEYLRDTAEYRELLVKWNERHGADPESKKPEPETVIGDLLVAAFLPAFLHGTDHLDVHLTTTVKPFYTNGTWDEHAGQVRWSDRMLAADSDASEFPILLYACWSEPDAAAQTARFGKLVLVGEALSSYCLWYRGLATSEAREWDTFLADLLPGDDLAERIRAFRFSGEQPGNGTEPVRDLAATARDLILSTLADE